MALDEWDRRRGRGGRPWERLKKELLFPGVECEMPECRADSREIIFGLRKNHPLGPSLDHIVSLHDGGHPTARHNVRRAHFGCNSASRPESLSEPKPTKRRSRDYPF